VVDVQPEPESADDTGAIAKLRRLVQGKRDGAAALVIAMPAEQLAERVAERVRVLLALVASGDSDAAATLAVVLEGL
jgi:hypothetical protein